MIVDLLVHIDTPDGSLEEPARLMEAARAAGLDGVVLAASGTLDPDLDAYRASGAAHGVTVFRGVELETDQGLVLAVMPAGETLEEGFAPKSGEVYAARAAIDGVEGAGGVTVALRPYDRDVPHPMGDHLFSLQGLDACEVRSGRAADIANDLALEAASNLDMPCVGASSARGTEGLGTAATLLRRPVADEAGLIGLVKEGACWPVAFSDGLPPEAREDRGRGPRARSGRSGRSGPRGEGRGAFGREGRSASEGRGAAGREGRSASDGRKSRGRGGRRSAPTRVTSAPEHADRLPDDVGNRAGGGRSDEAPPDDIGNRLAPGESSPFHDATRRDEDE
jgi:hypothetical protein